VLGHAGSSSCLLGWAGLLLSTTTLCLQKHKEHTCKTAQQQDVSTAKERGVGPDVDCVVKLH
jgi:hypothetical protein